MLICPAELGRCSRSCKAGFLVAKRYDFFRESFFCRSQDCETSRSRGAMSAWKLAVSTAVAVANGDLCLLFARRAPSLGFFGHQGVSKSFAQKCGVVRL